MGWHLSSEIPILNSTTTHFTPTYAAFVCVDLSSCPCLDQTAICLKHRAHTAGLPRQYSINTRVLTGYDWATVTFLISLHPNFDFSLLNMLYSKHYSQVANFFTSGFQNLLLNSFNDKHWLGEVEIFSQFYWPCINWWLVWCYSYGNQLFFPWSHFSTISSFILPHCPATWNEVLSRPCLFCCMALLNSLTPGRSYWTTLSLLNTVKDDLLLNTENTCHPYNITP